MSSINWLSVLQKGRRRWPFVEHLAMHRYRYARLLSAFATVRRHVGQRSHEGPVSAKLA